MHSGHDFIKVQNKIHAIGRVRDMGLFWVIHAGFADAVTNYVRLESDKL
jgi:hypothetical protein